ncbi:hypothetical protein [Winogradskyella sp. SYSU M77433]|uniref:hypothetical protein n=1 Tax=Winogradskyella sp. SYSU M77433 TaxID=3042722 RepID=UPI002480EA7F|nr:hypothetical protein [Winogradskyella sp. SYSU M77433]MDH7913748.1 hypothetical protein [Winogradskyella sp. SYSU M77433]
MKTTTKANLYVFGIFFVTYMVVRFLIQYMFPSINNYVLVMISAVLTVLLSPQRRVVRKRSGDEIQLKWLFSKKVITLK